MVALTKIAIWKYNLLENPAKIH